MGLFGWLWSPFKDRIIRLEAELAVLSKLLHEQKEIQEKIIIEELNVEKIVIDKIEYHNNFGALGIKELKGRLNIGANYGVAMPLPLNEEMKKELEKAKMNNQEQPNEDINNKKGEGPRVTYHKKDM